MQVANEPNVALEWVQVALRWGHFLAGVVWIGHLYFFNWVNAHFQTKLDAATKPKVNPELMPRALYWFRWGAAWTWVLGFLLMFMLYYHGPNLFAPELRQSDPELFASLTKENGHPKPIAWLPGLASLVVGFVVFDVLFRFLKSGVQQLVGAVLWGIVVIGIGCALDDVFHFGGRAVFIHMGAVLGTVMAANVWMRIWPAQRRIITAVKNGQAADPKDVATARDRSRQNTYMSVPLLLLMVSNHSPVLYGDNPFAWQGVAAVVFAIGFVVTWWLYAKSAKVSGF